MLQQNLFTVTIKVKAQWGSVRETAPVEIIAAPIVVAPFVFKVIAPAVVGEELAPRAAVVVAALPIYFIARTELLVDKDVLMLRVDLFPY